MQVPKKCGKKVISKIGKIWIGELFDKRRETKSQTPRSQMSMCTKDNASTRVSAEISSFRNPTSASKKYSILDFMLPHVQS